MKRLALLIAVLLLSIPTIVFASDITGASYKATVTVTENGTGNTYNTAVPFTVNLTGFLNTTATNAAMLYSGADLPFMPAPPGSTTWVAWNNSIGISQNINESVYLKDATGGKVVYYPGSTGMTITDDATLEPSDNFSVAVSGLFDTGYSTVNQTAVDKPNAFRIINGASGNISVQMANPGWCSPNFYAGGWGTQTNAYDNNTATYAEQSIGITSWTAWFTLFNTANISSANLTATKIRIWVTRQNAAVNDMDLQVYYSGAWHTISSTFPGTTGNWQEYNISAEISAMRMRFYNSDGASAYYIRLHEVDFYYSYAKGVEISTSGLSSDEYDLVAWADGTYLHMSIDGTETANVSLGGVATPGNSSDWLIGYGGSGLKYMESFSLTQGGIERCNLSWEYDTTFTDASGNGNDGAPTFRTTSSNANVTANLTALAPISQSQATSFSLGDVTEILTTVPGAITHMYTELNFDYIPMGAAVNAVLTAADVPQSLWWYPVIFISIIILGFIAYNFTSMRINQGRLTENGDMGSLAFMCVVVGVLLALFGIMNPIPFWPALLFWIPATAILLSQKHQSIG